MRKLIRPSREEFEALKKQYNHTSTVARRRTPPDATGEEFNYLKHLGDMKIQVVVHLKSGEECKGWVEYFDHNFIRITMPNGPNRFIYKNDIIRVHEESTPRRQRFRRPF